MLKVAMLGMGGISGSHRNAWKQFEDAKVIAVCDIRPEKALLKLRSVLGLYTNLRPARLYQALRAACPLRESTAEKGFDLMMVRELTGGIYFGERGYRDGKYGPEAYDTEAYSELEIRRILKVAFETARKRGKKVTSIDKANVLDTSRLWRKIFHEMAAEYPDVAVSDMLVDNAAMQLIRDYINSIMARRYGKILISSLSDFKFSSDLFCM